MTLRNLIEELTDLMAEHGEDLEVKSVAWDHLQVYIDRIHADDTGVYLLHRGIKTCASCGNPVVVFMNNCYHVGKEYRHPATPK